MKMPVHRTIIMAVLLLLGTGSAAPGLAAGPAQEAETPGAFVGRLQGSLQAGDISGYLQGFIPELRDEEKDRLDSFFVYSKMTGVALRAVGLTKDGEAGYRAFLQAFFQNAHSAMIETWVMTLERRDGSWAVVRKAAVGNTTTLYKIRIPSERSERARRVDIVHEDIRLSFADPAVFYDNIPGLETAMVIVGNGTVVFSPDDANERHQMELLYKKSRLEDTVDSLYVRCSPGTFASNITIESGSGLPPVTDAEKGKAASLFGRSYSRSFTIESSFDGGLLSFLPQSDEMVLDFKARKAGELTYIYYPFSDDEVHLFDRGRNRVVCLYSPERAGELPLKRFFISFAEKFDILSYVLDLSYSPSASFLSGQARIEFISKVAALDSLKFRFSPDLEILKITDGQDRELFYTRDNLRQFLYVYLLSPSGRQTPAAITVYYRGKVLPQPPTTDVIGQTPTQGRRQQIVLQPRFETYFFSQAGNWYPGPAEEDYFQVRLTLIVPPEYGCIANGGLVRKGRWNEMDDVVEMEKAGDAVYAFESRAPVKYMSFIVGRFERKRERAGPVPLEMHVSTEILDSRPGIIDQAADILDFYVRSFGPYPYDKLGIVLRRWPTPGGHSPASFIVLNEVPWQSDSGFQPPADTPVDLSEWEDFFLAHEIAHQWWGQGVSFDSHKDQWLSEGLSQFAAASYLRRKYGEKSFAAILKKFSRWTEKKSFRGPVIMGSRLSHYDFAAYQSIVYNKAALAMFMLQDLVGKEPFEAGLRGFFEKHRFRAARTGQFIEAMEAASGRDLKAFFEGWFFTHELPDVQTSWTETAVPGGVRLDFQVTQVRGRFVFPLWVEWAQEGRTFRHMIAVDESAEKASLTLPRRPEKVRINPEKAVPGKFR
jgi:hypothetical protein